MIVFINQKIKKIELYDKKGLVSIPFTESWKLKNYIKEGRVLYITNAVETTMDKIMETVASMRGFGKDSQGHQIPSNDKEPLYIHYAKGREYLNMASIGIMFKGVTDFYAVDKIKKQFGDDIFEKDDILKIYLGNGKLEIVTASEMNQFLLEYVDEREEKFEKSVSSLIINDKVEKFMDGGGSSSDENAPDREGAVVIDLSRAKSFGGGGGGGSTENESSLLPEDF